jgi:hypothetical protein
MFGLLAIAVPTLWEVVCYAAAIGGAVKVTLEAAEIARRLRQKESPDARDGAVGAKQSSLST